MHQQTTTTTKTIDSDDSPKRRNNQVLLTWYMWPRHKVDKIVSRDLNAYTKIDFISRQRTDKMVFLFVILQYDRASNKYFPQKSTTTTSTIDNLTDIFVRNYFECHILDDDDKKWTNSNAKRWFIWNWCHLNVVICFSSRSMHCQWFEAS